MKRNGSALSALSAGRREAGTSTGSARRGACSTRCVKPQQSGVIRATHQEGSLCLLHRLHVSGHNLPAHTRPGVLLLLCFVLFFVLLFVLFVLFVTFLFCLFCLFLHTHVLLVLARTHTALRLRSIESPVELPLRWYSNWGKWSECLRLRGGIPAGEYRGAVARSTHSAANGPGVLPEDGAQVGDRNALAPLCRPSAGQTGHRPPFPVLPPPFPVLPLPFFDLSPPIPCVLSLPFLNLLIAVQVMYAETTSPVQHAAFLYGSATPRPPPLRFDHLTASFALTSPVPFPLASGVTGRAPPGPLLVRTRP